MNSEKKKNTTCQHGTKKGIERKYIFVSGKFGNDGESNKLRLSKGG